MKALALSLAILFVAVSAPAHSQPTKPKTEKKNDPPKKQKEDDLPDVGFQIPEETSAEVKAVMTENAQRLFAKQASDRVKAAHVLGELGEKGKPVRIVLCRAMLDPETTVRVAAADALKNIDAKMQYLAVALMTEEATAKRAELYQKIKKLEDDGVPLSPIVAHFAVRSAAAGEETTLIQLLTVLGSIARNDIAACDLLAGALDNKSLSVRSTALKELPRMKHGKLVVKKIILLLNIDSSENRIAAIEALTSLADESTEEILAVAIAGQRYHKEERVRKAVEIGLNKLQNREKPSTSSPEQEKK
jgi:HEAT repeat protein